MIIDVMDNGMIGKQILRLRKTKTVCFAFVSLFFMCENAFAQSVILNSPQPPVAAAPIRNYGTLRIGGALSHGTGRPTICLDVSPVERFSIEACGNGGGILHNENTNDLAHFRSNFRFYRWLKESFVLDARAGLGMAELQIGKDSPGFAFKDTGRYGTETAGPEGAVSAVSYYKLGKGFEFVTVANAGLAYLAHAPELLRPSAKEQFFITLSTGLGF